MKRFKIFHQTSYYFSEKVQLLAHTLRLRPREGHELRIESSKLDITPAATLRWHRDAEGNSVAIATFASTAHSLLINSETIIQQYDQTPYDFLVADYAVDYPFHYTAEEKILLAPYMAKPKLDGQTLLAELLRTIWQPPEAIQSFALLLRLNKHIYQSLTYSAREEEGVQTAVETLFCSSGSCRDFANLFMVAARQLGFAARFVSGYICSHGPLPGATHAWAEVFLPGAGWKGFDQTTGNISGVEHIAVAVARLPESVPPIAGAFHGVPGSRMDVSVIVSELV